jgi:hypothetical protein
VRDGEGGKKDAPRIAGARKPGARIFARLHLIRAKLQPRSLIADLLQPDGSKKLLREKEE